MQVLWLLIDVVLGVLLAGVVAPLALATLPDDVRGPGLLLTVAIACIVGVSLFRHVVVGRPGTGQKH